jgi:hypothetical protein
MGAHPSCRWTSPRGGTLRSTTPSSRPNSSCRTGRKRCNAVARNPRSSRGLGTGTRLRAKLRQRRHRQNSERLQWRGSLAPRPRDEVHGSALPGLRPRCRKHRSFPARAAGPFARRRVASPVNHSAVAHGCVGQAAGFKHREPDQADQVSRLGRRAASKAGARSLPSST